MKRYIAFNLASSFFGLYPFLLFSFLSHQGNQWKPGTEDLTTSGYHTSKNPKVEELDEKYLSRSLGPFDKSPTHCVENPSLSWLSYEQSLLIPIERASETGRRSSTRRRTRFVFFIYFGIFKLILNICVVYFFNLSLLISEASVLRLCIFL